MKRIGLALAALLLAGCAQFPVEDHSVGPQPTLNAPHAEPAVPEQQSALENPLSPPAGSPSALGAKPDPCIPTDPAIVAACLKAPWGLSVLPDGVTALVTERTTGRILLVGIRRQPQEIARISDFDANDGGGVLGVAVGPAFDSDGLIFVYVTTATDNRVVRIAGGIQRPILTDLPRGKRTNPATGQLDQGGALRFGADGNLYVATATGDVLRVNLFGEAAKGNPGSGKVFTSGMQPVTGLCLLPDGTMVAVEQRAGQGLLRVLTGGADDTSGSADTLWSVTAAEGGAVSCASSPDQLGASSLTHERLLALSYSTAGAFTGSPQAIGEGQFGRLLTLDTGRLPDGSHAFWATTSNRDGHGKPVPADDRVVIIPAGGRDRDGSAD